MTLTNTPVQKALLTFTTSYITNYQNYHQQLPVVEADKKWTSPCEQGKYDTEKNFWKPVNITSQLSFTNIEQALNINIHSDIVDYYTYIYSESIDAETQDGKLSLLLPWNKNDFERLQQNMIGHIMMKQKLKQKITLFFAVTDEDDMIISLDNESGEIWVEQVGCIPHKKLADNLAQFLNDLTPIVY